MNNNSEKVFTIKMTRALEDNVFFTGVTIYEMMETAGQVIAEEIENYFNSKYLKDIVFLVGFGNNGGDGLVAARYLLEKEYSCKIVVVGDKTKFNSLASQENYNKLKAVLPIENWYQIREISDIERIFVEIGKENLLIDCIFGIGIQGSLREPYYSLIDFINQEYKGGIISVDLPSGYDSEVDNEMFIRNPKKIICIGRNKIVAKIFSETETVVRNIGIPLKAEKYIGFGDLKWYYPRRKSNSHKRQNGVITIIAGSMDYIGAPALAGMGAFRTGADLIFILTPSDIRNTVASYRPDFITIPASQKEIEPSDIEDLFSHPRIEGSSFIIGPGMMNSQTTRNTLLKFLENEEKRQVVIDASALSMMDEEHLKLLKNHNVVLTPHKGEFRSIFGINLTGDLESNSKIVTETAQKWNTTILLKGEIDIISNGKITKFNETGHPGMSVGGTGDVLTGIVAALLSVTEDPFLSSCLGVFISGAAGELAARSFGDGLIASDIPNFIYPIIEKALNFRAKEI
ncbi:MAG: NAD(P)H-hydrate dehydratase [Candidatus Heimdallarchaeota archaeon]|nr:NAD(P)H-hydrate dehydratase [Candidatus Heimdallarchaeota archaeon]MCG3256671.1 NAD(P)H-hydrate dehydratase [Candidatus Heimdallarchaeota archaeon]MCK4611735.1 NAD(P)H-hydrate dehydratase [Candidatus Heimdallarchaeota archaeon]